MDDNEHKELLSFIYEQLDGLILIDTIKGKHSMYSTKSNGQGYIWVTYYGINYQINFQISNDVLISIRGLDKNIVREIQNELYQNECNSVGSFNGVLLGNSVSSSVMCSDLDGIVIRLQIFLKYVED